MARKPRSKVVHRPQAAGVEAQPPGLVEFEVKGPLPRWAPYKRFRSRLYVPADTRLWRGRVAKAFLSAGGHKPKPNVQVTWSVEYRMVKSHADLDSLSHSLQDSLSKDALRCVDKEWHVKSITHTHVNQKSQESAVVKVEYKERNGR